jgi:presqualene diphosphate synthase
MATLDSGAAPASAGAEAAASAASGSSFYMAMRILPKAQREGMYAVYAFCRAVDDIADGDAPHDEKIAALGAWRQAVDAMQRGGRVPPELAALRPYDLRREDFLAVIDGMEMDANGPIVAPDEATLDLYCERVASAVGRLSNRVFGLDADRGDRLAHHLGRALQLTNILRDLDEDAGLGRLYLPREVLEGAGIPVEGRPIAEIIADPRIDAACRVIAARAESHFREAGAIMDSAERARVKAPRLMAAAYGDILRRLLQTGWAPPRTRLSMNKLRLLGAMLRYGIV